MATKMIQLSLLGKPERRKLITPPPYRPALDDELLAAGWRLQWLPYDWVKAVHPQKGETREHFVNKHRGLRDIEKEIRKRGD